MLTDAAIRALKAECKPVKKADGGGLFILAQPGGQKYWRLAYRFAGKQKTLSGGPYPIISLADARQWRDSTKRDLIQGRDPSEVRKAAKRQAAAETANSFETVANAWLESRRLVWSTRYARIVRTRLEDDVYPELGHLNIGAIEPPTLLAVIRKIEQRGAIDMAHRVKNYCGEVFRFGIADAKCTRDPSRDISAAMKQPPAVKHRAKVQAKDLTEFFGKLRKDEGARLSHLALRWTILTMVRTQETRFAKWSEIEGRGTDNALWRIPADRMKMRSEHIVPLAPQAEMLLDEIEDANAFRKAGNVPLGQFLFPVAYSKTGTISENRMLDIMYRLGLRGKATVHGFRGLASTVLNESGSFEPDWIEAQLAHIQHGVRAAYNAALYLPHRRRMMIWWGEYLEQAGFNSQA
jgi:integrase